MSHLNILLPASIPPAEMAADLLRALKLPHLAALLNESTRQHHETFPDFSPAMPHELWLARARGEIASLRQESAPPVGATAASLTGFPGSSEHVWFVLQPSHFHVARDHLVLTDVRQLEIPADEARALFETVRPLFDEAGFPVHFLDARRWLVQADDWHGLKTTTPDVACGHNIDLWMPKGAGERAWRRLHNEVQMHWHTHPVNAAREARGARPVNALWLWGGSWTAAGAIDDSLQVFEPEDRPEAVLSRREGNTVLVLDALLEPALAGDWAQWLSRFTALDDHWLKPIAAALKGGQLRAANLVLTGDRVLTAYHLRRSLLKRTLRRPSLSALVPA